MDNGASIICRAENPKLNRTHILEEIWNLNVVCKFLSPHFDPDNKLKCIYYYMYIYGIFVLLYFGLYKL